MMTILKTLLAGAVLAACFAGPSYAQSQIGKAPDATPMQQYEEGQQRERESIDKQYRSTLQKTRANDTAKANDPWANMRGDADVKPKAKR